MRGSTVTFLIGCINLPFVITGFITGWWWLILINGIAFLVCSIMAWKTRQLEDWLEKITGRKP